MPVSENHEQFISNSRDRALLFFFFIIIIYDYQIGNKSSEFENLHHHSLHKSDMWRRRSFAAVHNLLEASDQNKYS